MGDMGGQQTSAHLGHDTRFLEQEVGDSAAIRLSGPAELDLNVLAEAAPARMRDRVVQKGSKDRCPSHCQGKCEPAPGVKNGEWRVDNGEWEVESGEG